MTPAASDIEFHVEPAFREPLGRLPWDVPIDAWSSHGVRLLDIKRGPGRHPVVFADSGGLHVVVKELSVDTARREVDVYRRMLERGIHTLVPLGYVVRRGAPIRVETPAGPMYERGDVGHTVTMLVDRVLPDSQLYRRAFRAHNRQQIWDAIVDVFVEMHVNGVFWGDASLANTLVKFLKEDVPYVGKRTILKAYVADAETVEIHDSLSDEKRTADVSFFLESMEWIDEDLRSSGMLRDDLASEEDRAYILGKYSALYDVAVREKEFVVETGLLVRKYLGRVRRAEYLDLLRKHIDEHKWYISEERSEEVGSKEAAQDWLEKIFVPITELLKHEGALEYFPGKTASELYVEIMNNKYYMSLHQGSDVGMVAATQDYVRRFGTEPPMERFLHRLTEGMLKILGMHERKLFLSSVA